MWNNIVERGRLQMIIWRMRIACWIPKATHTQTYSEYVILIATPLPQRLDESPTTLRYMYISCIDTTKTLQIGYISTICWLSSGGVDQYL